MKTYFCFNTEQAVGNEALELKPFIAQRWSAKYMKRIPFSKRLITHNIKRPLSKAGESDCLFNRNPLCIMIMIQSPKQERRSNFVMDR